MGVWGGLGDISVCRMNTGGTLSQVTILYYFDRVFCSVPYFLLIRNGVLLGEPVCHHKFPEHMRNKTL